ncbi:MAG: ECF transporter S component [Caldisericia bacterium]|jgi:riboflavin transporter FmnP|nr:ECF transporter S component [Caldisericia bacterium]
MRKKTKELVLGALLAALSFISMYFIQIPIFASAPYLQFDPSEIFTLFAAFFISPTMGVLVTLVKVILFYFTKQESGIIGSLMNFFAVAPFVYFAGVMFKKLKNLIYPLNYVVPILIGTLVRVIIMIPLNLIFLPLFIEIGLKETWIYIYTINIPFNIIVSLLNGFLFIVFAFALFRIKEMRKKLVDVKE